MLNPAAISYPAFLMCAPFGLSADVANNIFMDEMPPEERIIDRKKVLRQFIDLYNFVSSMSLVYLLPSILGLQDLTYTANMGIVLPHIKEHPVIISNFKSKPRRGEVPVGVTFFNMMGLGKVTISPPYFEGEADCKFLRDNIYFMPYGIRTSMNALKWFKQNYQMNIIPIKMTNPYQYHLDCIIFPLTSHKVILETRSVSSIEKKSIEKVADIIAIPNNLPVDLGTTNCLRLRRMILIGSELEYLKRTDKDYDNEKKKVDFLSKVAANNSFEPIVFNLSGFKASGADLSCMFMHLNYSDFMPGRSEDG